MYLLTSMCLNSIERFPLVVDSRQSQVLDVLIKGCDISKYNCIQVDDMYSKRLYIQYTDYK